MLKAAIASLALHGALWGYLRTQRTSSPAARATVELEIVSRPEIIRAHEPVRAEPMGVRHGVTSRTRRRAQENANEKANANANGNENENANANANGNANVEPLSKPNLFALSALGHAAGVDLDAAAPSTFRPKHGVGSVDGRGGIAVGDFLAEDAGRERAQKGLVPPFVREVERTLHEGFAPPFAHVDNANRKELLHKQFMGFLRTPPKTGELARGLDPARETTAEKLKSTGDHAFFLGRRVLVFARQLADGSIAELSIRQASGFRAFDEDALAAVEKALAARPPRPDELRSGEVRTLWQLDATGYVVIAPEPTLKFDESTGKSEWIYPLQKRVDKAVKLLAVY